MTNFESEKTEEVDEKKERVYTVEEKRFSKAIKKIKEILKFYTKDQRGFKLAIKKSSKEGNIYYMSAGQRELVKRRQHITDFLDFYALLRDKKATVGPPQENSLIKVSDWVQRIISIAKDLKIKNIRFSTTLTEMSRGCDAKLEPRFKRAESSPKV